MLCYGWSTTLCMLCYTKLYKTLLYYTILYYTVLLTLHRIPYHAVLPDESLVLLSRPLKKHT